MYLPKFRGAYCLHKDVDDRPGDGGSKHLRNVGMYQATRCNIPEDVLILVVVRTRNFIMFCTVQNTEDKWILETDFQDWAEREVEHQRSFLLNF
jgi:hypothetical protein